ncbi:energy transducer TonB [bacterium]|nr:energy transducer TonB [bacterium]
MVMCRTYSPYGAWELKRHYQRNLLIANGLTILFVIAAVAVPSLLTSRNKAGPVDGPLVPRLPVETVVDLSRDYRVIPDEPVATMRGGPAKPVIDGKVGWNLTPVIDDLNLDANEVIADQDQLRGLIDGREAPWDSDEGTSRGLGETSLPVFYPPIDSFVSVEIQPRMVYEVQPEYPRLAKEAGLEGKVWIKVLVDIDGSVRDAVVVKSSESAILDQAALEAAYSNRFSPAIQNGRPIPVWAAYQVDFRLTR